MARYWTPVFQEGKYPYFLKMESKNESESKKIFFSSYSGKNITKAGKMREILSQHRFWKIRAICCLKSFLAHFLTFFSRSWSSLFKNVSTGLKKAMKWKRLYLLSYLWEFLSSKNGHFLWFFSAYGVKTWKIQLRDP